MKRPITLMVAMLLAIVASAQKWQQAPSTDSSHRLRSNMKAKTITPTEGQLWWGYFTDSDASSTKGVGTGANENFEAAIFIPANHCVAGNATIKALRIWINNSLSSMTGMKIWITKTLAPNAEGAKFVQIVDVSSLAEGANDIELSTPYPVNGEAIYVGFSMDFNAATFPIMCGGGWEENSLFLRSSVNVRNWGPVEGMGKLALQMLLDNVVLSKNYAAPSDFGTFYIEKGKEVSVPVKISNYGENAITSLSYTITTNGVASSEKTISVNAIPFNKSNTVNFPFPSDNDARKYTKTLTITKVNGVANEAKQKTATGVQITILEKPVVMPVVEEFTGTWCGWCPIGFDGMKYAAETFGDKVALIAVHKNDIMQISEYDPIKAGSYPSSIMNRELDVYPSSSSLQYYINQQMQKVTVGSIEAEAEWTDGNKTGININTQTKFVYSDDNGQYGIAYVLLADGLTGSGYSWAQNNNLSGNSSYSTSEWYSLPSPVYDMTYDHVAIAAWDVVNGADNSINPVIKAGESQKRSFAADISNNSLVQDKSKLKVVTLLIDRTTGFIVNAAQTTIKEANQLKGDVNGDGAVTITDATMTVAHVIGAKQTGFIKANADLNGDNDINIADVMEIVKIVIN